ncbi:hemagglutinin repeat-containing protein [Cronobacter dublinensis]|uniref:hemagglutinin repeat-containing protein n=1 Tax=Cronobacter dublinensis TaxID=413497 RepID=UPI0023DD4B1A|nr:hemagglutinin repeat-containing protein [Cronobacter dublinensis]MDT3667125.1 hemagglutinin repeat-containing protein [Cronobacter dublinensis]WEP47593.1 hemagglutinin repeat-containing protein [Cronobacter dublinensis]
MDTRQPPVRFSARLLSYLIISLLVWQPVAPAFAAAMTPTGPTGMDKAANGVPVVNIARPNAAGISHNQFKDYNVGKEGVILNNATGQMNQTQLGGIIQNNPNLRAGQEARGIINEVTGGSRSQLNGYTEVAGKAANVMVANPYGITCNGCGFINTPNVTLTTGKPTFDAAGNLATLDVTRGTITVEGKGLDASQSDALSIISRATEVNAAIHARDLNVTVGANRVGTNGSRTAIAGEGPAPVVAVDTGALGGMYANRIRLVSGDKGVGVNLGNLNARQGDITLDASGRLAVKNSLASGTLTAKGDNVTLSGEHKTGGALAVSSRGDVALRDASLASDGAITLAADGTLSSAASTLTSGQSQTLKGKTVTLDNATRVDARNDVTLNGGALENQAQVSAGGSAQLSGERLTNSGQIAAKGRLETRTTGLTNSGTLQGNGVNVESDAVTNSGTLQSGADLTLNAATLDQQGTLSARGDAALTARDSLNNRASAKILTDGTLTVNAGTLTQNGTLSGTKGIQARTQHTTSGKGALTTSQGDIRLDATQDAELNGQTMAAGNLTLTGDAVTTQQGAQLQSGRDLSITARDATLNGTQAAKGALDVTAQRLSHGGKSDAAATRVTAEERLANSGTLLGDALTLRGKQITNSGLLQGDRALSLFADRLDNLNGGTLYSAASLSLDLPALTNQGLITTDGDLTLRGGHITNGGLLQSQHALEVAAGQLDNLSGGTLYGADGLRLTIPTLSNQGLITTNGDLTLHGQDLVNGGEINGVNVRGDFATLDNRGRLLADNAMTLSAATLNNDGTLAARQLTLTADRLHNLGLAQGDNALNVTAGDTENQGALRTGGTLDLQGETLTNRGELSATALLLALAKGADNSGRMIATDSLNLTAPAFTNSGTLAAATLELGSDALTNRGTLQGTRELRAHGKALDNQQGGVVLTGGALTLVSDTLTNAGLLQGDTLALTARDWRNDGNALGQNGVMANINGTLTNQGNVLSQQAMTVNAGHADNGGALMAKVLALHGDLQNSGLLQGSEALTWDGASLTNAADGQLTGGNTLALNGTTLANQGQMQARAVTVTGDTLRNGGTLQATDSLTATLGQQLDNQGKLLSQNQARVSAATLINDGALAARALDIQAPDITNRGTLAGNDSLTFTTRNLYNGAGGQIATGAGLTLDLGKFENQGLLSVNDGLTLRAGSLTNGGDMQAGALDLTLNGALDNSGRLIADGRAQMTAGTLTNSGSLAGEDVTLGATSIRNGGLIQGTHSAGATAQTLTNDASGTWLSGGALTLHGADLTNAGQMQGDTLTLTGNSLDNRGVINGIHGVTGTLQGALTSDGQIVSRGDATLTAGSLTGSGRLVADNLTLRAATLTNNGLWQGTTALNATGDTITTGANARTLSGGALTLNAGTLTTGGTLQGQQVTVDADTWTHGGALISLGGLGAQTQGTLTNNGSLLSQGAATVTAGELANNGDLLSQGALTLDGQRLTNRGALQGDTLTAYQNQINNQGSMTGAQGLTLTARPQPRMARMLLAAPARELINGANGALLTGGTLRIDSGAVTNAGRWQGQQILLNAQRLDHSGAIQSADGLNITLSGDLNSLSGSKITALGAAALDALAMINQGEWTAKNLTLTGDSLRNEGAITGVNGLTTTIGNDVTQTSNGKLLTGGALTLNAGAVNNQGAMQGGTLGITTGGLTNSGRLQGDNGATLIAHGAFTNNAGGQVISRQALAVTTPVLVNNGLIQGGGNTRVDATTSARNDGKLLSGGQLTLTTPQFTGAGWLQAATLILNAANATNSGTWLADQGTLTGTTLTNQGTTQGGALTVNYGTLNNNGTLLGNNQLTVNANQVNQQATGKLFSGGDLLIGSTGLNAAGQLVALGNLTLNLTSAFNNTNALAAGKTLTVTSNGAIDNRGVLQGQAVNVSAGGALTNNGQITTGSGASTLSGSSVALNGAGTLQGGGDVNIASRGNITVDGFTGTRGSLTLTAPGSIINTALLYAANNLALYANSITNQRGDILAGNSLWMQKDAAGNANAEVVNTSGNIETQNGDITIKTGHLLNQRDGLTFSETKHEYSLDTIPGATTPNYVSPKLKQPDFWLKMSEFTADKIGWTVSEVCTGGGGRNNNEHCRDYYSYHLLSPVEVRRFLLFESEVKASANGPAARLASGGNITVQAGQLENKASNILAGKNMSLSGTRLNNFSAEQGRKNVWQLAEYRCDLFDKSNCSNKDVTPVIQSYNGKAYWPNGKQFKNSKVPFVFTTQETEFVTDGGLFRSVISAQGNIEANFSDDISNTSTSARTDGFSNAITAPSLNTLSHQSIGGSVQKQALAGGAAVAVNSPEWKDQLQGALQQINGGGALENGAGGTSLANISTSKAGKANLGSVGGLANAGVTAASAGNIAGGALASYQSKPVDTSAYPLPSGNNGFFVVSDNPKSPYLINVNPKLDGLGELDPALFGDLNKLLGVQPGAAPRETRASFTNEKQFLGSSYMLGRLNLNPEYDYRFLGDAAFDTRYVSNTLLNQTGNRYLNGVGSDLQQMQYLMDSAAAQQKSLGLQFGVALTRDQIASLDKSILWWETATVNGETVMIPKLYLSPKDVTVNNGSVIAGNNVSLKGGDITNSGSTLLARQDLKLDSQNSISNLNDGLMKAGGSLNLSAIGDINNISSAIRGKTVALESADGSINNITLAQQTSIDARNKHSSVMLKDTTLGSTATISAQDSLALQAGKNITITGANLASGGDLLMNAWGDIAVNANQVNDAYGQSGFRNNTNTSRSSVTYQGSTISAGGNLGIKAGDNLRVAASDIKAGGSAALAAGEDLNLDALQTSNNSRSGKKETHSTGLDRTTVSAGDNLTLSAGRDINARAAALAAEDNIGIQAGRDVNLEAEATTTGDSYRSKKKTTINESVRQQGTELASGGNTVIVAGRDMNADAAQAIAKGDIGVTAGRDINLATATESDYHYKEETKTKKGFLKKTTTHTVSEQSATREAGTLLSGDNVTLKAGEDLLVKGSAVAGDGNVALSAGKNVDIVAATNTDANWQLKEKKKSGLMGSGGIGFTIGSNKTRHELKEKGTTQSQSVSTVGSTGGDVSITAGEQARVSGADLVAGKNLTLTGDSVIIEPGHDKRTRTETFEQKSSGLTVALSGAVGDAVNSAVTTAMAAKEQSDSRLAGLQATKAVLSGAQAVQAGRLDAAKGTDPSNNASIGVMASLGAQSSKSKSQFDQDTTTGSTLNAGKDLSITATGKGQTANRGDISIGGSELKAGNDITLNAARDINLVSSANVQKLEGSNSSKGGSIGVGLTAGSGGTGINISASMNAAKGSEKGNGTTWNETTLDAGRQVNLTTGRDATLSGAQVNGQTVKADIGRDLNITSLQDSDNYKSKQQSVSAGGSVTIGAPGGSANVSYSRDAIKSNYDSVIEQAGIYAGKGGFDITVGNHTQLNGAVIGSTATADKNRLETGTLGFTDIRNKADYKVEHQGAGFSSGGGIAGNIISNVANTALAGLGGSGHAEGTTQSAVSEGTITIRDKANQQQNLADLSRDTAHANDSISPIFNKEKEQNRLQAAQLISDIGLQASDIVKTQGAIEAAQKANSQMASATQAQKDKALEELKAQNPKKQYSDKEINQQVWQNFFNNAQKNSDYGTGGKYQRAVQAVTAAVQGLAGGNVQAALAGGAAPYLAEQVKKQIGEDNIAANAVAHAIVGGIVAELSGRNGLAGAAGAASGELAAKALMTELYPGKTASQLSEEEKQTLSALSTLAAGLAGGVVGDSSDSAFTGAQAGKNAVENNHLNTLEKLSLSNKKKEYSSSCQGENADNESCKALKQDIDKLNEKGQSIDKTEYSELGPDFQLGGVDSIKHTPGEVVSCVGSSNGYCTVTDVSAVDGKEWKLEPANQVQAITEKYKNEKTEDFIKALGAAYFEGGCGMPGVASALCQSYSAFGGANPISGKVPTDAERITWALNAAANLAAGKSAIAKGNAGTVIANDLKPHELKQAQSIVNELGGAFEGVPKLNVGEKLNGKPVTSPDYPVIDGWYKTSSGEKISVSLKELSSSNPLSILQDVSKANKTGKEFGISSSTMFVDAKNMSSEQLIKFANNGPLSGKALQQGVIDRVVVRTNDGFVTIEAGAVKNQKPKGW